METYSSEYYSVCTDCIMYIAYCDLSGIVHTYGVDTIESHERADDIIDGVSELIKEHGSLIALCDTPEEFSIQRCECCGTTLAGERHTATTLG